jgi:hypothetical protein
MHSQQRIKPYSTKKWAAMMPCPTVAKEFEQFFIKEGWSKVNNVYGKRCANRWYIMLGAERLKAARARYLGRVEA